LTPLFIDNQIFVELKIKIGFLKKWREEISFKNGRKRRNLLLCSNHVQTIFSTTDLMMFQYIDY